MTSMPESLRWFLFTLTGELPLEADADAALEISRIYQRSAEDLEAVTAGFREVTDPAMDALPEEVAQAFTAVIDEFADPDGILSNILTDLRNNQQVMANISLEINESLRQIILSTILLAMEISVISAFLWTGPVAWAQRETAVARTRFVVRLLKQRPLASAAALGGHSGMQSATQSAETLIIQLQSMISGPDDRRRHKLDVQAIRAAALVGSLAGAGSAVVVWALRPLVVLAGPKGSWKHGTAKELSEAVGATTEGAAEPLATGVVYGHWQVTALPFAGGAVAHATRAALGSGTFWASLSVKSALVVNQATQAAATHVKQEGAAATRHPAAPAAATVPQQAVTLAIPDAPHESRPAGDAQPGPFNSTLWRNSPDHLAVTESGRAVRSIQLTATPVSTSDSPVGTQQERWSFAFATPVPGPVFQSDPSRAMPTLPTTPTQAPDMPQVISDTTPPAPPEAVHGPMSDVTLPPARGSHPMDVPADALLTDQAAFRITVVDIADSTETGQEHSIPPPAELNSAPGHRAPPETSTPSPQASSSSSDGRPLPPAPSHGLPSLDGERPELLVPSAGRPEDREALESLETARRADLRFAADAQADLRLLATTLLRSTDTTRRPTSTDLLRLTKRAMAAGRAGSLAALEAFHLQYDHGVLNAATKVATPDGPIPVRNWQRSFLPLLQLDVIGTLDRGGRLVPEKASWKANATYPVLPEHSPDGQFGIRGDRGTSFLVSAPVLGELLHHDPMRPDGWDVALLSTSAGQQVEVLRVVADGIGRMVFAPSSELVLAKRPGSDYHVFAFERPDAPALPTGRWIPGEPGLPPSGPDITLTGIDGSTVHASALLHYPLLSASGRSTIGGAVFEPEEMTYRQYHYRYYGRVTSTTTQELSGQEHMADLVAEPNRTDGYNLAGHDGERGFLHGLRRADGTTGSIELSGRETAQVLRRRSSFQAWKLRGNPTRAVNADFCGKRHREYWATQDALSVDQPGTDLATGIGARVNTPLARASVRRAEGPLPDRMSVVRADLPQDGRRSTQHWPMPDTQELDALLHSIGGGLPVENAAESRERVRRWVRALRQDPTMGLGVEGPADWTDPSQLRASPEYRRLLSGFAALERMRLSDPESAPGANGTTTRGPLDSAMWKGILKAHQHLHSLPEPDPQRLLTQAAAAVSADPDRTLAHFLRHPTSGGAEPGAAASKAVSPGTSLRTDDASIAPDSAATPSREPFDAQEFVRGEFGDYILTDPDLPDLVRGAEALHQAWAAGPPDRGSITLTELATMIPVRFPPDQYMPDADSHRALLRLAAHAEEAGRDHSPAQLASLQLERHGALDSTARPPSVSGAPVLNWHAVELNGLDLLRLRRLHLNGTVSDHTAPWPPRSLYSIAGDPIVIQDYQVTLDVATDLVLTKALNGRRRDVVLLIPHAGSGTRPAVRRLATDVGGVVWSLDGTLSFVRAADGANVATTQYESTGRPVARMIPTHPNPYLLDDSRSWFSDRHDTIHRDRDISAVTLLRSDGSVYGTAYVDPLRLIDEQGTRGRLDGLDQARHYTTGPDSARKPLPRFSTVVVLPSAPGRVMLHNSYGGADTPSYEAAPFLLRTIDLGMDDGPLLLLADGAALPGPDDEGGTPPLGHLLAEGTRQIVVVPVPSGPLRPMPVLRGDVLDLAEATSAPMGWVVFRPSPDQNEVNELLRLLATPDGDMTVTAGSVRLWDRLIHSLGAEPSPEARMERVRDEHYLSLLRGFAALERMRAVEAGLTEQHHEPMTESIWQALLEQHRHHRALPRTRPRALLAEAHVTGVAVPGTRLANFLGSTPVRGELPVA